MVGIALCCYGHTSIPTRKEEELARNFENGSWDRPEKIKTETDLFLKNSHFVLYIVKEPIREPVQLSHRAMKKMPKELNTDA